MRAHRHPRFNFRANPVLGHTVDGRPAHRRIRYVDHFRINACPYRFEHGFPGAFRGQIDRAGPIKIERDARLVGRN